MYLPLHIFDTCQQVPGRARIKTNPIFSRFWFIAQVCRVCTPGMRPVGFAEFWLADQACSLVLFFVDCEFLLCWYLVDGTVYGPRKGVIPHCGDYSSIRAACSILPAVIRFIQCVRRFQDSGDAFPHLVNAGKYSTTLLKGNFFPKFNNSILKLYLAAAQRQFRLKQNQFNFMLWVGSETISSCYCLWWDLTQDWGLFEKRPNASRRILRSRLLFSRQFYFFGEFLHESQCDLLRQLFQPLWKIQSCAFHGRSNSLHCT